MFSFDAMWRDYLENQLMDLLNKLCNSTGHVAIHGQKITKHMRSKYKESRVNIGRRTFYIFPIHEVPYDIYYKVVQPMLEEGSA